MPLKGSVWRCWLKWLAPNPANERFEEMMAAGRQLERSLKQRAECRRFCSPEGTEAAADSCTKCTWAIEEAQRLYDEATERMRDSA